MEAVCNAMKSIRAIIPTQNPHWVGDAFYVRPVFGNLAFSEDLSPFLMFDYGYPKEFKATKKRLGVGQHPHRGFETVTIAFQGEVEHEDSKGNKGVIGPGDVQWMTAAKGIIHEEYISPSFMKTGGILEMAQIWVNLRSSDKMIEPRYQPILHDDIPVIQLPNEEGHVRVISGDFIGNIGAAKTYSPVNIWDIIIKSKKTSILTIPDGFNTIIFIRQGSVKVCNNDKTFGQASTILLTQDGSTLSLESLGDTDASILILSGEPLNEPIAARGPFVMNTQKEIQQAMVDYQNGKLG